MTLSDYFAVYAPGFKTCAAARLSQRKHGTLTCCGTKFILATSSQLSSLLTPCTCIFQGQHLKRGSRLVDFDIKLGDSKCVPVSLTDNQVECRPPTNAPNKNINNTSCQDDTLSTDVCIRTIYYTRMCHSEVNYT